MTKRGITGAALLKKRLPEQRFIVPGILPIRSVGLLASPPKSMKSFLALAWSCAIANGGEILGKIPVDAGEVLYLDLESHESMTRSRLQMICKDEPAPEGLHLHFEWPRLDQGGLEKLDEWFTDHPKAKLLIVDVFGKIAPSRRGGTLYESDYNSVEGLRQLAARHNICCLLVVHTRKAPSPDALARIAGSNGLTGAVDVILSLVRPRGDYQGQLFVSGRQVSEQQLQLQWSPTTGKWNMHDDAAKVMLSLSPERLAVVEFLQERGVDNPAGPKLISESLDMSYLRLPHSCHAGRGLKLRTG